MSTNSIDYSSRTGHEQPNTETRILRAAEHEFLSKGFDGARTTAIAEAAGVTHAMLHYYFRTKSRLFERIISEKANLLRIALSESIGDPSRSLEELLSDLISVHIDFISENPELPRFLLNELFPRSERSHVFFDRLTQYIPHIIIRLQKKIDMEADAGRCRRLDARMILLDVVSLNIFPFLVVPAINQISEGFLFDMKTLLQHRKQENLDTIMRKLKP